MLSSLFGLISNYHRTSRFQPREIVIENLCHKTLIVNTWKILLHLVSFFCQTISQEFITFSGEGHRSLNAEAVGFQAGEYRDIISFM